ncbi:LOW QUALITY PROTEIN: hypothetical protein IFM46972_10507 [Aspergillus udagawae]|uniref:Uncharacterized protein n=1 Tax=Aspergillus udagawae TaxID=91492 RepID=A0A8H3XQ98_9EURO|nr:LOW QUALITY PROTEIN: hypothetical protein IFM46972_10507 [Aspergillus udagawae]
MATREQINTQERKPSVSEKEANDSSSSVSYLPTAYSFSPLSDRGSAARAQEPASNSRLDLHQTVSNNESPFRQSRLQSILSIDSFSAEDSFVIGDRDSQPRSGSAASVYRESEKGEEGWDAIKSDIGGFIRRREEESNGQGAFRRDTELLLASRCLRAEGIASDEWDISTDDWHDSFRAADNDAMDDACDEWDKSTDESEDVVLAGPTQESEQRRVIAYTKAFKRQNSRDRKLMKDLAVVRHIPFDGRIQFAFDLPWLRLYERYRLYASAETEPSGDQVEGSVCSRIRSLREFDSQLRKHGGFYIVDDLPRETITYELPRKIYSYNKKSSEEANSQRRSLESSTWDGPVAPWRRAIVCQGLSTVSLVKNAFRDGHLAALPYLATMNRDHYILQGDKEGDSDDLIKTVKLHLSCERRVGGDWKNPYRDGANGFHVTFYEKVANDLFGQDNWKTGRLYVKDGADEKKALPAFRRSAFTMYSIGDRVQSAADGNTEKTAYWTTLLLCPTGFLEMGRNANWTKILSYDELQNAELAFIASALREIAARWADLEDYMAGLLSEDFMDPEEYVKLLFDNDTFSRSKLYFWMIGCLNDFIISIEDNITQWQLLRKARMMKETSAQFDTLVNEVDSTAEVIKDIQQRMKDRLDTVQALRDGLFNASALMESRISTRLGENVKLLTIFYLPLGFCAALWAVPNIMESTTRTPFIITSVAVAAVTYLIVFNIGNLAGILWGFYRRQRANLVTNMKDDREAAWQRRGHRLDQVLLNGGSYAPSEWLVLRYQLRQIRALFQRKRAHQSRSAA